MSDLLRSEKGMTILEVLVTSLIILFTLMSIYIGVVYAEKTVLQNYRDRVATLLASGELEQIYFDYSTTYNGDPALIPNRSSRDVVIDLLPRNKKLQGRLMMEKTYSNEFFSGTMVRAYIVTVTVQWNEPSDKMDRRSIVLREDFYVR